MIIKLLQGAFIGLALVLPGLSAGTVLIILGLYRRFLEDVSAFKLAAYLPLASGAVAGGLGGVYVVSYLLTSHSFLVRAFLLGMLLASVPLVLGWHSKKISLPGAQSALLGIGGFVITWFYICEPARTFTVLPPGGPLHFFLGGTLASATMILPGISGSSILIIMNLYEDVIHAVSSWQWLKLAYFSSGFLAGFFILARLLSALYRRYMEEISFLLAGLILGSTRILLPGRVTPLFLVLAAAGAFVVLYFSRRQERSG